MRWGLGGRRGAGPQLHFRFRPTDAARPPHPPPSRRLALLLLAALLLGAAAAQPAAVARAAARSPVAMLALDLLPSPAFTIQSFDGTPRPASDDKLRAYCKLLHTRTPGVCFAAGEEGDFARWVQGGGWAAAA